MIDFNEIGIPLGFTHCCIFLLNLQTKVNVVLLYKLSDRTDDTKF